MRNDVKYFYIRNWRNLLRIFEKQWDGWKGMWRVQCQRMEENCVNLPGMGRALCSACPGRKEGREGEGVGERKLDFKLEDINSSCGKNITGNFPSVLSASRYYMKGLWALKTSMDVRHYCLSYHHISLWLFLLFSRWIAIRAWQAPSMSMEPSPSMVRSTSSSSSMQASTSSLSMWLPIEAWQLNILVRTHISTLLKLALSDGHTLITERFNNLLLGGTGELQWGRMGDVK